LRLAVLVAVALLAASCSNDTGLVVVFESTTTSEPAAPTPTTTIASSTTTIAGYGDQLRSVIVEGDRLPPLNDFHADPAVGRPIPTLIGEDYSGGSMSIGPDTGSPMLLVVLAHWCPHCNNEIPELNRIRDADLWPKDLVVVGISSAVSPDRPNFPPERWLEDKDWTYSVLADGIDEDRQVFVAGDALGVTGYPFMVVVDGNGIVRGRWSGERGADSLVALVSDLIDPPADV
jgi:thiol-disulfide isomerase/thioredoxin